MPSRVAAFGNLARPTVPETHREPLSNSRSSWKVDLDAINRFLQLVYGFARRATFQNTECPRHCATGQIPECPGPPARRPDKLETVAPLGNLAKQHCQVV